MKVQEVISSCIMFIVSGLVLVGFTIAWFTNTNMPAVTGMLMQAVEVGHVRVALTSGGEDVSELEGDARYAKVSITESPGAETQEQVPIEFAPGAYGTVTFYVTPVNNSEVRACDIVPTLWISQDGSTWYPGVTESSETGDDMEAVGEASGENDTMLTLAELYEIAGKHIEIFSDADMETKITADAPYVLEWTEENAGTEQTATIYWKWHYEWYDEYPLSEEEQEIYKTQEALIDKYDQEDMLLGNNVSHMKFYVTFSAR